MKKRILTGMVIGVVAGIIDVTPMIIMNLPWSANLSAFSMWVVVGFLLGITELKIHGILKGIILSLLVLLPTLFIIMWEEPMEFIFIPFITIVLGGLAGMFYHILIKPKKL
jgi:hypothetical protein